MVNLCTVKFSSCWFNIPVPNEAYKKNILNKRLEELHKGVTRNDILVSTYGINVET